MVQAKDLSMNKLCSRLAPQFPSNGLDQALGEENSTLVMVAFPL